VNCSHLFCPKHTICWANHRYSSGFSLHDLLITTTILSLVATIATGMGALVQRNMMTAEVNTFMGHLNLARSEAIKRRSEAVLCPSRDGRTCSAAAGDYTWWHEGYMVFADQDGNGLHGVDEPVLAMHVHASAYLTIKSSRFRRRVIYRPSGTAGGTNATFVFCEHSKSVPTRYVVVSNAGRPRVTSTPTSPTTLPCP
jgi:type IV fimbrial biogenesis protein FimT